MIRPHRAAARGWLAWLLLLSGLLAGPVQAHKPSDSYLWLDATDAATPALRWDLALRDLETLVGLDADGDGVITWGELRAREAAITAAALSSLQLRQGDQACQASTGPLQVVDHSDGAYAVLQLHWRCPGTDQPLTLDYRLLADLDPSHRGLLQITGRGGLPQLLGPDRPEIEIPLAGGNATTGDAPAQGALLWHYLREGVWHIWIGLDHLVFLFTLLLPAVWIGRSRRPAAVGQAGRELVRVVTAFTLAHSVTLAVSVLGWWQPDPRWVEAAIALSVVVAALNNLLPILPLPRWGVALGFGLIHGFGFANVLVDLGLPAGDLALALFAFNVGVELGQLALVALVFPLLFALRGQWIYRWGIHGLGSLAAAGIGGIWLAERLLAVPA